MVIILQTEIQSCSMITCASLVLFRNDLRSFSYEISLKALTDYYVSPFVGLHPVGNLLSVKEKYVGKLCNYSLSDEMISVHD